MLRRHFGSIKGYGTSVAVAELSGVPAAGYMRVRIYGVYPNRVAAAGR